MPEKKKEKKGKEIKYNNSLPSIFADALQFGHRSDDVMFLRFLSGAPDGLVEQVRVFIPKHNLQGMITTMCNLMNFQPKIEKPKKEE